jgi:hypothetical protein
MALAVNGTIELTDGLSVNSAYGRTQYRVNDSSSEVLITTDYWVSEQAYIDGKNPLSPSFNVDGRYAYDRTTDGIDVLDFTNQKIKSALEELGYSVAILEL